MEPKSRGKRRRRQGLARTKAVFVLVPMVFLLTGCPAPKPTPPPPAVAVPALIPLQPSDYPVFSDDMDFEGLEQSILQSISYLRTVPAATELEFGPDRYSAAHLLLSLQHFQGFIRSRPGESDLQKYIRDFYRVYRSAGRDPQGQVLFTGYYEPELAGRSTMSPDYRYPVYGRPNDLLAIDLGAFADKYKGERLFARIREKSVIPYHDRREIEESGVLLGKAQPLAWVGDPVELFFLHIQGSGRIVLENGQTLMVGYDSSNGRPYRSIGQLLIEEGSISREEMSLQRIRSYFKQNPGEIQRILNSNPSYIFFRLAQDGPFGALNVRLTPGRSMALDKKLFPPSALAFAATQKPLCEPGGNLTSWTDLRRFLLNQDTGGAIVGPGRADLFWGRGPCAELAAGHLKHAGRLYFLILKPDAAAP